MDSLTRVVSALYDEYARLHPRARSQDVTLAPRAVQRRLLDQLLCIRSPRLFPEGILEDVESILASEARTSEAVPVETLQAYAVNPGSAATQTISLFSGDITLLKGTAIVNPANTAMRGCFQPTHKCLDNVVHSRAGPSVRLECDLLMDGRQEVEVGEPLLTGAGVLDCPAIVHVAGPQIQRGRQPTQAERLALGRAYSRSLDVVAEVGQTEDR